MSLLVAFEQCLARYPHFNTQSTLTVAYSGGVDSHVLLHLARQYCSVHPNLQLNAIHVNHGISALADQWQKHCQQHCEQWGIPLKVANCRVQAAPRESLEAAAREARYRALQSLAEPHAVLLLGQHLDDQAETFLLQLKRGAGSKGLSAMPEYSAASASFRGLPILRPLLSQSRADILAYANAQQLDWVDDDSNTDVRFDRNFLRHEILPLIQQRWPSFAHAVGRSARLIGEQQMLIEQTAADYLAQCQSNTHTDTQSDSWYTRQFEITLNLPSLLAFSVAWQKQIVRLWLQQTGSRLGEHTQLPSETRLNELLQQLRQAKEDSEVMVVVGAWVFRRYRQQLYLSKKVHLSGQSPAPIFWRGETNLNLPSGNVLRCEEHTDIARCTSSNLGGSVLLSLEQKQRLAVEFGGLTRRFKPVGAAYSKPLKQWFKLWQVPPWHRALIPLLVLDGQLVMVGDRYIAAEFAASSQGDDVKRSENNAECDRQRCFEVSWLKTKV